MPIKDGLVKSINHQSDDTGTYVFNSALVDKRLEVLRQLVPNARLVGFLVNPNGASTPASSNECNPPHGPWPWSCWCATPRRQPRSTPPS